MQELHPQLDKAGWGVPDPRNPGEWLADGYDTADEALRAARIALKTRTLTILPAERRALLAILHGAQDDDDGNDAEYTLAIASLLYKIR